MLTLPTSSASSRLLMSRAVSLVPAAAPDDGRAGERRGVHPQGHADARIVDGDHRQRPGIVRVGQGVADHDLRDAGHGDDVARARPLRRGVDPVQGLGDVDLRQPDPLDAAVVTAPGHRVALLDPAVADPAQRQPADVGRGVQVGDQRLEGMPLLVGRRRDALGQQVEEHLEIRAVGHVLGGQGRLPGAGVAVHDRELDLLLVRAEIHEQLVHGVDDLRGPGVGTVDLVDDADHRQPGLERLAQHEAGLGQRALAGVDEQQHAVDHRQAPLHLAAEVGVARRVDDVDGQIAVVDGGVLGQDGDAFLPFEVHRVHDPLGDLLVGPEGSGLAEHGVHQRGFAVVDVGHDGDIAEIGALHEKSRR